MAEIGLRNSSIQKFSRNCQPGLLLRQFYQMYQEAVIPDCDTVIRVLGACANLGNIVTGKYIHACMWPDSLEFDTRAGNALVNLYAKCARIEDAKCIFDYIADRDMISWSTMIMAHTKHGRPAFAFQLLEGMLQEGCLPNRVTFISILSACSTCMRIAEGKRTHARVDIVGDIVLETAVLNLYGKCDRFNDAQVVFNQMVSKDIIAWNAIITASTQQKQSSVIFYLFVQMQREGLQPDKVTFTSMVDACANHVLLIQGMLLHTYILEKEFESDTIIGTALLDMYGRCNSIDEARCVFDKMPNPNNIAWNALIAMYGQKSLGKEAIHLFYLMEQKGWCADNVTFVSTIDACASLEESNEGMSVHICIINKGYDMDLVIGNALLKMYSKHKKLEDAECVFNRMSKRDIVTWTLIISIYSQGGYSKEALSVFDSMRKERVHPDKVAFITGLSACTSHIALEEAKQMHAYILDSGIEIDIEIWNALVTMYSKCGNLEISQRLFFQMPVQDLISWNAVITAFAQHGLGRDAVRFYGKMQVKGFAPSKVTLIGVLAACNHGGLVAEGCHFFISIDTYKGELLDVDHYDCMIDLLGRSGCLLEAQALAHRMPFQPTALSYLALLGACSNLSYLEQAEQLAKKVYELDPHHSAPYVILSNIHAAARKGGDVAEALYDMSMLESIEHTDFLELQ